VTTQCHSLLRETAARRDYLSQRDHAEYVRRADLLAGPLSGKQQVKQTIESVALAKEMAAQKSKSRIGKMAGISATIFDGESGPVAAAPRKKGALQDLDSRVLQMPAPHLSWLGRVLQVVWPARLNERLLQLGNGGAYLLERRSVCGLTMSPWVHVYRGQATHYSVEGLQDPNPEWLTEHVFRIAATHAMQDGVWTSNWSGLVTTHCPWAEADALAAAQRLRQLQGQRARAFATLAVARTGNIDVGGMQQLASTLTSLVSRLRVFGDCGSSPAEQEQLRAAAAEMNKAVCDAYTTEQLTTTLREAKTEWRRRLERYEVDTDNAAAVDAMCEAFVAEVAAGGCSAVRVTASGGALNGKQRQQLVATLANMTKQWWGTKLEETRAKERAKAAASNRAKEREAVEAKKRAAELAEEEAKSAKAAIAAVAASIALARKEAAKQANVEKAAAAAAKKRAAEQVAAQARAETAAAAAAQKQAAAQASAEKAAAATAQKRAAEQADGKARRADVEQEWRERTNAAAAARERAKVVAAARAQENLLAERAAADATPQATARERKDPWKKQESKRAPSLGMAAVQGQRVGEEAPTPAVAAAATA